VAICFWFKIFFSKIKNPVAHKFNDILFSIPRFLKCLFRGDFDAFRRHAGVTRAVSVLLFEKIFGFKKVAKKNLNPREHFLWQKNLSPIDAEKVEKIWSGKFFCGD